MLFTSNHKDTLYKNCTSESHHYDSPPYGALNVYRMQLIMWAKEVQDAKAENKKHPKNISCAWNDFICSEENCVNIADGGSHIYKTKSPKKIYIAPLCSKHDNPMIGHFKLKTKIPLLICHSGLTSDYEIKSFYLYFPSHGIETIHLPAP